MTTGLLHKTDATCLTHFRLDAVLGFELLQKLRNGEFRGQDVHLPLHGGEIAGAELVQLREPAPRFFGEQRCVSGQRFRT